MGLIQEVSSHNGMVVFVRGNRDDYSRWESKGLKTGPMKKYCHILKKLKHGQRVKISIEVL